MVDSARLMVGLDLRCLFQPDSMILILSFFQAEGTKEVPFWLDRWHASPPSLCCVNNVPRYPTTSSLILRSQPSQYHPFGKRCFKSSEKVTSSFLEIHSEPLFDDSQTLPETAVFLGSLPLCLDSKYMANRAICQCLCLDKQSVSVLVYGFSWDQLCVLSLLNGRAVCKHPGIKPSGTCSGPTADLPGACVRHPLTPRQRMTTGLVLPCHGLHRYQPLSCSQVSLLPPVTSPTRSQLSFAPATLSLSQKPHSGPGTSKLQQVMALNATDYRQQRPVETISGC